MGVRSGIVVARFVCGLSLLLLSAAQQKAFTLPASPPPASVDASGRAPAKKKKPPLTLQQTLPQAYASRVAGMSSVESAAPGDGRYPPFDPTDLPACVTPALREFLSTWLPANSRPLPVVRAASDLYSFRICVRRIGPPLGACAV